MSPDLESLRLLVTVAELGSLGGAARVAGIAQPSASKRLAVLERRLGVPLLERSRRGSALTAEGEVVVDWATQVLAAADELMRGVAALRRSREATLHVAASMTIAEDLVPRWLGEFQEPHPDVQVGLTVANSAEVARLIMSEGDVEIGFVEGPSVPVGLSRRTVGHDRLVVVAAPGHPWARRRRPIGPSELAETPLVVREAGSGTRETLARALSGREMAQPKVELGSNAAVKGAVAAGVGPAVLSVSAVAAELAIGRLAEIPVEGVDLNRRLHAVWRRGRRIVGPAAELLAIASRACF